MTQLFIYFRKIIAIFLTSFFILFNTLQYIPPVYANPINKKGDCHFSDCHLLEHKHISIPSELGSIETFYQGNSEYPVYYIQDAHGSLEAQENISKLINYLVENHGVKTVFVEGYEGYIPLDEIFSQVSEERKQKVSYFYMDHLRLGGAEYAYINRKKDFNLIGIESISTYEANIKAYEDSAKVREIIHEDLTAIEGRLNVLITRYFPKELKEFVKLKMRYENKELDLVHYLERIRKIALSTQHSPSNSMMDPPLPEAFSLKRYPRLNHLFKRTVEELSDVKAGEFFDEVKRFEGDLIQPWLKDKKVNRIYEYQNDIRLFKKLNQMSLTSEELPGVKQRLKRFSTQKCAQFIAELMRQPILLKKEWEEYIEEAIHFYKLVQERDETFKKNLDVQSPSIVVLGGFHQQALTKILKQKNITYNLIAPKITKPDDVHQNRYDFVMSGKNYDFEKQMINLAINTAKPKGLTLWMEEYGISVRRIISMPERLGGRGNSLGGKQEVIHFDSPDYPKDLSVPHLAVSREDLWELIPKDLGIDLKVKVNSNSKRMLDVFIYSNIQDRALLILSLYQVPGLDGVKRVQLGWPGTLEVIRKLIPDSEHRKELLQEWLSNQVFSWLSKRGYGEVEIMISSDRGKYFFKSIGFEEYGDHRMIKKLDKTEKVKVNSLGFDHEVISFKDPDSMAVLDSPQLTITKEELERLIPKLGIDLKIKVTENSKNALTIIFYSSPQEEQLMTLTLFKRRRSDRQEKVHLGGTGKQDWLKKELPDKKRRRDVLQQWLLNQIFPWLSQRGYEEVELLLIPNGDPSFLEAIGFQSSGKDLMIKTLGNTKAQAQSLGVSPLLNNALSGEISGGSVTQSVKQSVARSLNQLAQNNWDGAEVWDHDLLPFDALFVKTAKQSEPALHMHLAIPSSEKVGEYEINMGMLFRVSIEDEKVKLRDPKMEMDFYAKEHVVGFVSLREMVSEGLILESVFQKVLAMSQDVAEEFYENIRSVIEKGNVYGISIPEVLSRGVSEEVVGMVDMLEDERYKGESKIRSEGHLWERVDQDNLNTTFENEGDLKLKAFLERYRNVVKQEFLKIYEERERLRIGFEMEYRKGPTLEGHVLPGPGSTNWIHLHFIKDGKEHNAVNLLIKDTDDGLVLSNPQGQPIPFGDAYGSYVDLQKVLPREIIDWIIHVAKLAIKTEESKIKEILNKRRKDDRWELNFKFMLAQAVDVRAEDFWAIIWKEEKKVRIRSDEGKNRKFIKLKFLWKEPGYKRKGDLPVGELTDYLMKQTQQMFQAVRERGKGFADYELRLSSGLSNNPIFQKSLVLGVGGEYWLHYDLVKLDEDKTVAKVLFKLEFGREGIELKEPMFMWLGGGEKEYAAFIPLDESLVLSHQINDLSKMAKKVTFEQIKGLMKEVKKLNAEEVNVETYPTLFRAIETHAFGSYLVFLGTFLNVEIKRNVLFPDGDTSQYMFRFLNLFPQGEKRNHFLTIEGRSLGDEGDDVPDLSNMGFPDRTRGTKADKERIKRTELRDLQKRRRQNSPLVPKVIPRKTKLLVLDITRAGRLEGDFKMMGYPSAKEVLIKIVDLRNTDPFSEHAYQIVVTYPTSFDAEDILLTLIKDQRVPTPFRDRFMLLAKEKAPRILRDQKKRPVRSTFVPIKKETLKKRSHVLVDDIRLVGEEVASLKLVGSVVEGVKVNFTQRGEGKPILEVSYNFMVFGLEILKAIIINPKLSQTVRIAFIKFAREKAPELLQDLEVKAVIEAQSLGVQTWVPGTFSKKVPGTPWKQGKNPQYVFVDFNDYQSFIPQQKLKLLFHALSRDVKVYIYNDKNHELHEQFKRVKNIVSVEDDEGELFFEVGRSYKGKIIHLSKSLDSRDKFNASKFYFVRHQDEAVGTLGVALKYLASNGINDGLLLDEDGFLVLNLNSVLLSVVLHNQNKYALAVAA